MNRVRGTDALQPLRLELPKYNTGDSESLSRQTVRTGQTMQPSAVQRRSIHMITTCPWVVRSFRHKVALAIGANDIKEAAARCRDSVTNSPHLIA
jgi:hypothetical protein